MNISKTLLKRVTATKLAQHISLKHQCRKVLQRRVSLIRLSVVKKVGVGI